MPQQPYREEPCKYVYQVTLNPLQSLLDVSVFIETDAAFLLTDVWGNFSKDIAFNLRTPSGRWVYSVATVQGANAIGTALFPVPVDPPMLYPAGSRLGFNLVETGNFIGNAAEIVFSGVRRVPIR